LTGLPGATASVSEVKNSMRGALGLRTRVGVGSSSAGVLVAPKMEVGDGPPAIEAGVRVGAKVGEPLKPGVRVAVSVDVGVMVGRLVGITWTAVPSQAARRKRVMSRA
jgi:hypothetical protein